ncbi:MAG: hypothetical protein ACLP3Q_03740 [Streptosporangiaceae bacterium]
MLAWKVPDVSGGSLVNQMNTQRPRSGPLRASCTTPLTSVARATGAKSVSTGAVPARSWKSAPGLLPRVIWALVMVVDYAGQPGMADPAGGASGRRDVPGPP